MDSYPFDLGNYSRAVTTGSSEAQRWFDRGLNWTYGYNWDEAASCFATAVEYDPACVMAYWGLGYVAGPNYNRSWDRFDPRGLRQALSKGRDACAQARRHLDNASAVEQALNNALLFRYQSDQPAADMQAWNTAYANEMRTVYRRFGDDPDVAALFVEALMNRSPWKMWDLRSGQPADGADTMECLDVLSDGIGRVRAAGRPQHPGLWHLYLHLMEMSPVPEQALGCADELRALVPDAGHLVHMPTHIDVQCGNYRDVVNSNHAATCQDMKYFDYAGPFNLYTKSRAHNYHFTVHGALLLGQFQPAMEAVEAMHRTIPDELIRTPWPPYADWLEGYMSTGVHTLVRFGRWKQLIDEPLPRDQKLYCTTTAMLHYGKGIAHAALKHYGDAEQSRKDFESALGTVPGSRYLHVVKCRDILEVARQMLAGEVAYHRDDFDTAFRHLRQAVRNEDNLPYDEPWAWMMPSRHALGALLLEQGHVAEAASIYEADLGLNDDVIRPNRHPDNVWALIGLDRCYQLLGKAEAQRMIGGSLRSALARADDDVRSSCFCSTADLTLPSKGPMAPTPESFRPSRDCCHGRGTHTAPVIGQASQGAR